MLFESKYKIINKYLALTKEIKIDIIYRLDENTTSVNKIGSLSLSPRTEWSHKRIKVFYIIILYVKIKVTYQKFFFTYQYI